MVITLMRSCTLTWSRVFIFFPCVSSLQLEFLSVGALSFVTDLGPKGL